MARHGRKHIRPTGASTARQDSRRECCNTSERPAGGCRSGFQYYHCFGEIARVDVIGKLGTHQKQKLRMGRGRCPVWTQPRVTVRGWQCHCSRTGRLVRYHYRQQAGTHPAKANKVQLNRLRVDCMVASHIIRDTVDKCCRGQC